MSVESPFAAVQGVISEPSNAYDDLRIIAGATRLDNVARAHIRSAADEMEAVTRSLISTNYALIAAQQRQIATNDQLIAARRDIAELRRQLIQARAPPMGWSMSTGWVPLLQATGEQK